MFKISTLTLYVLRCHVLINMYIVYGILKSKQVRQTIPCTYSCNLQDISFIGATRR